VPAVVADFADNKTHCGSGNDVGNPDDFPATFFDCRYRIGGNPHRWRFLADDNHFAGGVDMREIGKQIVVGEKERDETVGDNSGK